MTVMRTPGATPKMPKVTLRRRWDVLMCYVHMVDVTWLFPVYFELSVAAQDDFRPTLEEAYRSTECCLELALPVITHKEANIVREFHFVTQDYNSLTAGASTFLFVAHTSMAAKNFDPRESFGITH